MDWFDRDPPLSMVRSESDRLSHTAHHFLKCPTLNSSGTRQSNARFWQELDRLSVLARTRRAGPAW
jgi:hypothetical protein